MKSKASIAGHPIHPILVGFPITFYTSALGFDTVGLWRDSSQLWHFGNCLSILGILSALLTAIPGVIDYIYTVPPQSSAKKRAGKHGILNVCVLLLFATGLYVRHNANVMSPLVVILEGMGFCLTMVAGWLGGTLSFRNQIGVYNRYANAGKWKEFHVSAKHGQAEVPEPESLETGQMTLLHIDGKRIVFAKTSSGYAAFEDRCTHKGGSLAGGTLACEIVQCPWHGSGFNVINGEVVTGPAKEKILTYRLNEENGKVGIVI